MSPHSLNHGSIFCLLFYWLLFSADCLDCGNVYIVNDTCDTTCCHVTIDGAITALNHSQSDSHTIYIQTGTYLINAPIQITNRSLTLMGYSTNATILTADINTHTLFKCFNCQITFKDLTIRDSNAFTISSHGLSTINIESVYIIHSETQWSFYDQSVARIHNCTLFESNVSLSILDATHVTLTQCHFIANAVLLQVSHSSQLILHDSSILSHSFSIHTLDANDVSIHLYNTIFQNSSVESVLYIANTYLEIDSCVFEHSPAVYSPYNSTINITSSTFAHCSSDCIHLIHSSLHLQSSSFFDAAISFISDPLDTQLYLTLIANNFSTPHSINPDGAAVYIQSQSITSGAYLYYLRDNAFKPNDANSIRVDVMNDTRYFTDDVEFMSYFGSIPSALCVAVDTSSAERCKQWTNMSRVPSMVKLHALPGSCETLYVYGFDTFGNPIRSDRFSTMLSSESEHIYAIGSNEGGVSWRNEYERLIPITILSEANNSAIRIYDPHHIAPNVFVNVTIQTCLSNQYRRVDPLNPSLYDCIDCHEGEYTIDNGQCEPCLEGIKRCTGGLDVVLKRNWFAKIEHNALNESYLVASSCAPGYCCGHRSGCPLDQTDELCAAFRDPDVKMCGTCLDGYSETLSGIGTCAKCDDIWHYTLAAYVIGCFALLFIMYKLAKKERKVSHPLSTYVTRTLLFYYQIYGFVTFRTFIKSIQIFTEVVNLIFNWDISMKKGTCLLPNVDPLGKLGMTFLVPGILLLDLAVLYVYIRSRFHDTKAFKNQMMSFYAVCDYIARIIYVEFTYAFCRLWACKEYEPGQGYVMLYAPNVDCDDVIWGVLAAVVVSIVFIVPAMCYYIRVYKSNTAVPFFLASILSYREQCEWYYAMDLFRRGLLVSIPLLPRLSLSERAVLLMVVSALLLVNHVSKMPYRWRINNYLEVFILGIIFISAAIEVSDEHKEFLDNWVIAFFWIPFFPVLVMLVLSIDIPHWYSFWLSWKHSRHTELDEAIQFSKLRRKENRNTLILKTGIMSITKPEPKVNSNHVDPSITSTRSGWKYKFKLSEYLWSKYGDEDQDNINTCTTSIIEQCFCRKIRKYDRAKKKRKEMDLLITFSGALPQNTMIDAFAIRENLNQSVKAKKYSIAVKGIVNYNNSDDQYNIKFQCRWNTDETEIQIETALMQIFEDNETLKNDLLRAFKFPKYEDHDDVRIIDTQLQGSISSQKKDEFIMKKGLEQMENTKHQINQKIQNKYPDVSALPLSKFSWTLLSLKIESWVYSDINYTANLRKTMQILAKHGISGKRVHSLGIDDVKKIVEHDMTLFMTIETFNIMFEGLESHAAEDLVVPDRQFCRSVSTHHRTEQYKTLDFAEIAWILYQYPLQNLVKHIKSQRIDGKTFLEYYRSDRNEWIKRETGWNKDEIYHINCVLLRHHTLRTEEINMHLEEELTHKRFNESTVQTILSTVNTFDLEEMDLRMKRGLNIQEFSACVANMIDELCEEQQRRKESISQPDTPLVDLVFDDDDVVKTIYDIIADAFIPSDLHMAPMQRVTSLTSVSDLTHIDLNGQRDWTCFNCGAYNFKQYIDGKMATELTLCKLCGIKERDSITMALMNNDTFVMVREAEQHDIDRNKTIHDQIRIDDGKTIQTLMDTILDPSTENKFDLSCLNRTDNTRCPCIMRLVTDMLVYKEWLDTLYNKTNKKLKKLLLDVTIQADVKTFIDNERFKIIFMNCAETIPPIADKPDAMSALQAMLDMKDEDLMNIDTFLGFERKAFGRHIATHIKQVKAFHGMKLFTVVRDTLKETAHREEYGHFLSSLDMDRIDKDYHHILRVHINEGNRTTIENVFLFFELALHYCDGESDIVNCRSVKRAQTRIATLERTPQSTPRPSMANAKSNTLQIPIAVIEEGKEEAMEEEEWSDEQKEEPSPAKDIWSLRQYYVQSQLDMMHTFLVHTDWQDYIQSKWVKKGEQFHRYTPSTLFALEMPGVLRQQTSTFNEENETPRSIRRKKSAAVVRGSITSMMTLNTHKFVTEITHKTRYGFGVDHCYIHLGPSFKCLRDELMENKLNPITVQNYQNLLTKAIKKHGIASTDYKFKLICKYFKSEYNIIRNEMIGIRHVLAIVIYTDMSVFCTAFRETYRKVKASESDDQITKRHRQLYWYSRFLFEAVEFFGQEMSEDIRVYHGLNNVLQFSAYTAYFNQPISSTTSFTTAKTFSQGTGVILKLKCGSMSTSIKPKYLSVSWLSVFPNEDEKLFYGENVFFEICDIIEASNDKSHAKELVMLNRFQKMVKNQNITWNDKPKMLSDLVTLIRWQRATRSETITMNANEEEKSNSQTQLVSPLRGNYITKYGKDLFEYFCNNPNRKWICIKNFRALPAELKNALFNEEEKRNQSRQVLSLIPLLLLFGNLEEIVLNDLNIKHLTEESMEYVAAVMHYVQKHAKTKLGDTGKYVHKIEFQSTTVHDGKPNSTLRKLANKHSSAFTKFNWNIQYEFRLESSHCLTFISDKNNSDNPPKKDAKPDSQIRLGDVADTNSMLDVTFVPQRGSLRELRSTSTTKMEDEMSPNRLYPRTSVIERNPEMDSDGEEEDLDSDTEVP